MHTFYINDRMQLFFLRHVSNNQVLINRKSVQAALWYFITQLCKHSGRYQYVFDTQNLPDSDQEIQGVL